MSRHRAARIADLIRRELSRALSEEARDPRFGFLTLTAVRVSSDLQHARVYVATPEGEAGRGALEALTRATPFLRKCLAQRAGLRLTPQIEFVFDEALETGMRLERLLAEIGDAREARAEEE